MTTQEQPDPLLKLTTVKRMAGDCRDCRVQWRVDFGTMEIHIHVDFIAPIALISFLNMIWHEDERLEDGGIKGVLQTCASFTIKLWVAHEVQDVCYRLNVCRSEPGNQLDIELTPFPARAAFEKPLQEKKPVTGENRQANDKMTEAEKSPQGEFLTPWGQRTSLEKQANCVHEWRPDGQTMLAVRRTCVKCGKSELY